MPVLARRPSSLGVLARRIMPGESCLSSFGMRRIMRRIMPVLVRHARSACGESCLSSFGSPRSASLGESCPANHACPRSARSVLVRLDHACPRSACGESCLSSFGSPRSACFRHAANHACTRSARSACSLGESCPANHACPRSACSHSVRSSFGSFHRIEATVAAHDWPDTGSVRPQAWVGLPRFS